MKVAVGHQPQYCTDGDEMEFEGFLDARHRVFRAATGDLIYITYLFTSHWQSHLPPTTAAGICHYFPSSQIRNKGGKSLRDMARGKWFGNVRRKAPSSTAHYTASPWIQLRHGIYRPSAQQVQPREAHHYWQPSRHPTQVNSTQTGEWTMAIPPPGVTQLSCPEGPLGRAGLGGRGKKPRPPPLHAGPSSVALFSNKLNIKKKKIPRAKPGLLPFPDAVLLLHKTITIPWYIFHFHIVAIVRGKSTQSAISF